MIITEPLYNTGIMPGDIAEYCILVGDPARAYRITERFENIECERKNREYVTLTGIYSGIRLTVMGTGMGCSNTEMAIVELTQCQPFLTLIRCGSCGGIDPKIKLGDVVISTAGVRFENTSTDYIDSNIPAIANSEVLLALIKAAAESGHVFHTGLTAAMASFFVGQGRVIPPFPARNTDLIQRLTIQKVANMEMEASTIFTLAHLAGHRAGIACSVFAERHANKFIDKNSIVEAENKCIDIVLAAFKHLKTMDEQKGNSPYWYPGVTSKT